MTARLDKVKRYFPDIEHIAPPAPELPFQTVHQQLAGFGKRAMGRKLAKLLVQAKLLTAGKRSLVITHQEFEEEFKAALPGVTVLHHGSVAGDDSYGDVEQALVYGARFPEPKEIARLASGECGRLVPAEQSVRTACRAMLADGSDVEFDRLAYANSALQAVHQGIYDSDVLQDVGRARGLNRGAADPVEIHVFGNLPLPFPLASIGRWKPPTLVDHMAAQPAINSNMVDAARMLSRRIGKPVSAKAMQKMRERQYGSVAEFERAADAAARRMGLAKVTWQGAGQGQRRRWSWRLPRELAAFYAEIEDDFGRPPVLWKVMHLTPGEPEEASDRSRKEASFPDLSPTSAVWEPEFAPPPRSAPVHGPEYRPDG